MKEIQRKKQPVQYLATLATIEPKLKKIFIDHIGKDEGITAKELFIELFNEQLWDNVLQRAFLLQYINRAMNKLRHFSNYFIVSNMKDGKRVYFIVQTHNEAEEYNDRLRACIKGFKRMITKCEEAVEKEKWKKLGMEKTPVLNRITNLIKK